MAKILRKLQAKTKQKQLAQKLTDKKDKLLTKSESKTTKNIKICKIKRQFGLVFLLNNTLQKSFVCYNGLAQFKRIWRNGRRARLRIWCLRRGGSSPFIRTKKAQVCPVLFFVVFYVIFCCILFWFIFLLLFIG